MESENKYIRIEEIVHEYPPEKRFSLAIMQDIQREFNYIPRESLKIISEYLEIPLSTLFGMATFYKALSLTPKGRYAIKICDGTACHIHSSVAILSELEKLLGIRAGEITSDLLFSVDTVNCLGACAIAPVMVINGEYHGKLKPQNIAGILAEYRQFAKAGETDE
jgi:NADH-quinone oxidoreductase subunit E